MLPVGSGEEGSGGQGGVEYKRVEGVEGSLRWGWKDRGREELVCRVMVMKWRRGRGGGMDGIGLQRCGADHRMVRLRLLLLFRAPDCEGGAEGGEAHVRAPRLLLRARCRKDCRVAGGEEAFFRAPRRLLPARRPKDCGAVAGAGKAPNFLLSVLCTKNSPAEIGMMEVAGGTARLLRPVPWAQDPGRE